VKEKEIMSFTAEDKQRIAKALDDGNLYFTDKAYQVDGKTLTLSTLRTKGSAVVDLAEMILATLPAKELNEANLRKLVGAPARRKAYIPDSAYRS
jgi:hypothetical protein